MSPKIKLFMGILVVLTLISVVSLFENITKIAGFKFIHGLTNASIFNNIETDMDKDGLNNTEESYWGTDFRNPDTDGDKFLDGEEIAAGRDPLIPGPNDTLLTNENLTEKFSNLTLSGYVEGSLTPDDNNNYEKSLDTVAAVIIDDALNALSQSPDLSNIKIVEATKENQENYLENINKPLENFLYEYMKELKDLESNLNHLGEYGFGDKYLIDYYTQKTVALEENLKKLLLVEVPQNWQELHIALVKSLNKITLSNRSQVSGKDDPIKATIALQNLLNNLDVVTQIISKYQEQIKVNDLSVNKGIFR